MDRNQTAAFSPANKIMSKSLPNILDVYQSQEEIVARFQSRAVNVKLYTMPTKWADRTTVFQGWDDRFKNNFVLVSDEGLPQDYFESSLAVIDETPCIVMTDHRIPAKHISIPPFFKKPDTSNNEVNFYYVKSKSVNIKSANINIVKFFTDHDDDYVFINEKELKETIIELTKNSLIISDQAYYCELKALCVKRDEEIRKVFIGIIFEVSKIKYDLSSIVSNGKKDNLQSSKHYHSLSKNDSKFECEKCLFEAGTRLFFKSDLNKVKISTLNDHEQLRLRLLKDSDLNGSNGVLLSWLHFYTLDVAHLLRPVIAVNGMAFLINGTDDRLDTNLNEGKLLLNESAWRCLERHCHSLEMTHSRLLNQVFPDAARVVIHVKWFARDKKCQVTDTFPATGKLLEMAKKTLKTVPLQKGQVYQISVDDSDNSRKLLEATIKDVSGNGEPQLNTGELNAGEQLSLKVYWLSDQTEIDLIHPQSPASGRCLSDASKSVVTCLTDRVAGIEREAKKIVKEIVIPRILFSKGTVVSPPPFGIILHGPTGSGKTTLALALFDIFNEFSQERMNSLKIVKGPELLNKYIGESESAVRQLFELAKNDFNSYGRDSGLHVIVIDEMDSLLSKRVGDSSVDTEGALNHNQVVEQFLTSLDDCKDQSNILLIGTTNRYDSIDDAVKRNGRIGNHYKIDNPDMTGRKKILELYINKSTIPAKLNDSEYEDIAKKTDGRNGSFLEALVNQAEMHAISGDRSLDKLTMNDIECIKAENAEINHTILLTVLNELNNVVTVDDALAEYKKVDEPFHKLECHGFKEHTDLNHPDKVVKYMDRVLRAKDVQAGVILIEGGRQTGKSHMVHHLVKEVKAGHLSVIKIDDLVGRGVIDGFQYVDKKLNDSRLYDREVIVIDHFDTLFDEEIRFGSNKYSLIQKISTDLKIKGKPRICILTTCAPQVSREFHKYFTINRKLELSGITEADMEKILRYMKTTDDDIKEILSLFKNKIPVGDFINIISPCFSQTDKGVLCDKEALEEDVLAFDNQQSSRNITMYT